MIKKLLSFILCLAPATAMAVQTIDPGTGNTESVSGLDASIGSIIVKSGKGIIVGAGGVSISGNMYINKNDPGSVTNQFYAETTIDSPFSIISSSDITVGGALDISSGKIFEIKTSSGTINSSFGSISNSGITTIENINNFHTTGTIFNYGDLIVSAQTVSAGSVTNSSGNINLTSVGSITMGDFANDSTGTANVTASSLNAGDVQNNAGTTNINLSGNLTSTGNLENSGTLLDVNAGNVSVAGTMKNDSSLGTLSLSVASLNVSGGDISNASFVNTGNFDASVSGVTHFEYGFDTSTMGTTNTFSLNTGTLTFGTGWTQLISNNMNSFNITVNNGSVSFGNIRNGSGGNTSANMDLIGESVHAALVQNEGNTLNITATDSFGGIYLTGVLNNSSVSTSNLYSDGAINIAGAITNDGSILINGVNNNLDSITNNGNLDISSPTANGILNIASNLTNQNGAISIDIRDVDIGGNLVNIAGTTFINATNSLGIGGVAAQGGFVALNSVSGPMFIDNDISVTAGSLIFAPNTTSVNIGGVLSISGSLGATSAAAPAGNVSAMADGVLGLTLHSDGGNITVGGNVMAVLSDVTRMLTLDANEIDIGGVVAASNKGVLVFGNGSTLNLNVTRSITSTTGGLVDLNTSNVTAATLSGDGKFIARGSNILATDSSDNAIDLSNGVWFDGTDPSTGFVIRTTHDLTLETTGVGADIAVSNGMSISTGNKLTMNAADQINVSGDVNISGELDMDAANELAFLNNITNSGTMNIASSYFTVIDLINTGSFSVNSDTDIDLNDLTNSGHVTFVAGNSITLNNISSTANSLDITGNSIDAALLSVTGGYANLNSNSIYVSGNTDVTGDLYQGATSGMLNLTQDNTNFKTTDLNVGGDFNAVRYTGNYGLANLTVGGDLVTGSTADVTISANSIVLGGMNSAGTLSLDSTDIELGNATNSGSLTINTDDVVYFDSFATTGGSAYIYANQLDVTGQVNLFGGLLQNSSGTVSNGDINIATTDLVINADGIAASKIYQESGTIVLNTSDLDVGGDIDVQDLQIVATGPNWLTANVDGNIGSNVRFTGLSRMTVGGDYLFDDTSMLHAAVLPRVGAPVNYWSGISLTNDDSFGQIINGASGEPLIDINGKFISNVTTLGSAAVGSLETSQFGVDIFDIVNPGSAIWLLHADDGIEELGLKTRNLFVKFCNSDGSICYNYLDALGNGSTDTNDTPIYLSLRDTNDDGTADSIYVVFDPRFGGPVEVFKIQPIVGNENYHTDGEYSAAGALDNLIAGRFADLGFTGRNPIETIPVAFDGTYLEDFGNELYNLMEQYQLDHDGYRLAQFSRLMQPREMNQITGTISLNEHTFARDFEDHMFDEFVWNRNRKIRNSWVDTDFGMMTQQLGTENRAKGNRFSISGGFDWQASNTLIVGLSGRMSHTTNDNVDNIDLGYKNGASVPVSSKTQVTNTNFGFGGYLMGTMNEKTRFYGNAFLDAYMLDISRDQNYLDSIQGSGTSLSLTSEWGLMHDWLNQYIVGNAYVRAGYNFGYTIDEKIKENNYMRLQSDGYASLTPGYSLIAQKRIYTSPWFQIRPNLSFGVEYDLLGIPESQFKFAVAKEMTDYKTEIDPLWANAGGGIECLAASGWQFGVDYRYQYNADLQIHKVKLYGAYRF
ncbi:MAG TPA: hypothetical protein PKJ33_02465 [Alphaproteobacteria bacterium]|nr:hypothetical protein [Alphaproteobacteria bacterium]